MTLEGKTVLVTGAGRRVGRMMAQAIAGAGANLVIHYHQSESESKTLAREIEAHGQKASLVKADLEDPQQAAGLIEQARVDGELFALVNSAAIFEPATWDKTDIEVWNRAMLVNLTAPFLLSQAFARSLGPEGEGRIVNVLDWRALRPGADHLPYTVSKAGLAALTQSMAVALAPRITVNGLALGAVLAPQSGAPAGILDRVPARRWAEETEVGQALLFLLDGPAYVTGEILHLDGGRHLV